MDSFLYTKIHEIFFCSFLVELYESIAKLANDQGRWRLDGPLIWTPELVRRLQASDDKIMCIVDRWLDHILGGFVIEFAVNTSGNYREAERCFFKGL